MNATRPYDVADDPGPAWDLPALAARTGADLSPLTVDDPEEIGGWPLIARLPFGGQSRVYLGHRRDDPRTLVAVKTPKWGSEASDAERLLREFANIRRVACRHVAQVLDSGSGAQPYLVMEFVGGPTLRKLLDEAASTPIGTGQAAAIATGLLEALAAVHAAGVAHRDLGPNNVVLDSSGRGPVLIDFGISHHHADERLTKVGHVMGTAPYMSPERMAGGGDVRADIFSWAVITALLLGGRHPYQPGDQQNYHGRMSDGNGPDLTAVPNAYQKPLRRALDPDPARRPSAEELIGWLDRIARAGHAEMSEPGLQRTRRQPFAGLRGLNAAAFLQSLLGIVAVSVERSEADRRLLLRLAEGRLQRLAVRLRFSRFGSTLGSRTVCSAVVAGAGVAGLFIGYAVMLVLEVLWFTIAR